MVSFILQEYPQKNKLFQVHNFVIFDVIFIIYFYFHPLTCTQKRASRNSLNDYDMLTHGMSKYY